MGKGVATAEQMKSYIRSKNPAVAPSVLDMIPLYLAEGEAEGVRGDIAFAQSCLETGNFTFSGSAVTLSQNNFCGLGYYAPPDLLQMIFRLTINLHWQHIRLLVVRFLLYLQNSWLLLLWLI